MSERRRAKAQRRERRREREWRNGPGRTVTVRLDMANGGRKAFDLAPDDPLVRMLRDNCHICQGEAAADGE